MQSTPARMQARIPASPCACAATRKPDYDAARYIHESIVSPGAFVVEGFNNGVMPQTFATFVIGSLALAGLLSLAGLFAYEWAFVMAPQDVPNS